MISLILLSAGLSSRFRSSPKALAPWGSRPLIVHHLEALVRTDLDEIIVVLGAHEDVIKQVLLNHNKIKVVYNKDYKFGQTSSFKCGLAAVSPSSKAVGLLPVDFPLVQVQTLNHLVNEFALNEPLILIPTYQNKKGHPPFFNVSLKNEILELPNDVGLNTISRRHDQEIRCCDVLDEGVLLSFNTPEEFQKLSAKII